MTPFDLARHYVFDCHLSIVPIKHDGTKQPVCSWRALMNERPTIAQLHAWFDAGRNGLAVVGGAVSGGWVVLDFDLPGVFEEWRSCVPQHILDRCCVVQTPRGWHVHARCPGHSVRNVKLLKLDGKTAIETRGEGGYALLPGCPVECHALQLPYVVTEGSIVGVQDITEEELWLLTDAASDLAMEAAQ
jgi:Bifunctional DNA primase/polymerase, N-terminal